ncbi:hypothetical protein ACF0H5_016468 [Mactra antiquata]
MTLRAPRSAPARSQNSRYCQRELVRDFTITRYMQKPPLIMPNYGKKVEKLGVPKTSLSRVLLYDNITQQQMLDVKLAHIQIEKQRAGNLMDMHRRAFSLQLASKRRKQKEIAKSQSYRPSLPNINLNKTKTSSSMQPLLRRFSTFSISDVQLPKAGNKGKQIVLKLKTRNGGRKLYHSYDESGIFGDFFPIYSFYDKPRDDPRFRKLETVLMSSDIEEADGFVVLSPSYHKDYPQIPEFFRHFRNQDDYEDTLYKK